MARGSKELSDFDWVVGIDEAGRGPIAGPVAVGAVKCRVTDWPNISNLVAGFQLGKDSKKLSEPKREEIFATLKKTPQFAWAVALSSNHQIDLKGIVPCIRSCIDRLLKKLECEPTRTLVILDGGLKAPPVFSKQQTIIKGDEKEPLIGLASIAAKVTRDRKMIQLAKLYPGYGFDVHKGYGTRGHYAALTQTGFSALHRLTFLKSIDFRG